MKFNSSVKVLITLSVLLGILLFTEVFYTFYDLNDSSIHQMLGLLTAEKLQSLKNPLDYFVDIWGTGDPIFSYYQMIPHFVLAIIHLALFKIVSVIKIYHILIVLLMILYPWSFYYSLKRLGVNERTALISAVVSLFFQSTFGFGHEFSSYVAYGPGLYTQLFAMVIFPQTLVLCFELLSGRRYQWFWPVVLLSVLVLSHLIVAYLVFVILGGFCLFGVCGKRLVSLGRMGLLTLLVLLAASFFLVPMLLNLPYRGVGIYSSMKIGKSFGMAGVLFGFFKGSIFDGGRLPVLSGLVVFGFILTLRQKSVKLALTMGFMISLTLFFGTTDWGELIQLLPGASSIHFHRFIIGVHFFGAALIGTGVIWLVDRLEALQSKALKISLISLIIITVIFSGFVFVLQYLGNNNSLLKELHSYQNRDRSIKEALFKKLKQDNPGRVYAGPRGGWGSNFKLSGVPIYFLSGYENLPIIGHLATAFSLSADFTLAIDENRADHLDLFNVTHILSWPDDTYWKRKPIYASGHYAIYRTGASGFFDVVDISAVLKANHVTNRHFFLLWLKSQWPGQKQFIELCQSSCDAESVQQVFQMKDDFHYIHRVKTGQSEQVSDHALFEKNDLFKSKRGALAGKVVSWTGDGNRYQANVKLDRPAAVLLKMGFHPFWRVRVDRKEAKPIIVSPGFVATRVDSGQHEVEFDYHPPWWKWALFGLFFLIPFLAWLWDKKIVIKRNLTLENIPVMPKGYKMVIAFVVVVAILLAVARVLPKNGSDRIEDIKSISFSGKMSTVEKSLDAYLIGGFPFYSGMASMVSKGQTFSRIFQLKGEYQSFETWVGLSDRSFGCGKAPAAKFEVWLDGRLVHQTPMLTPFQYPHYVSVNLKGKRFLKLLAQAGGNADCVHAVWGEGRLTR